MLTLRKQIFCSFLVTISCTGSAPDLDAGPVDPDSSEIGSKAPRLAIDVIEAGATGAVQVRSGSTSGPVVATCERDCTVPLAAGTAYTIIATSPSTSEISGVCASPADCTFTAALGEQTATVAFRVDAATKEEWAVTLPEPVHTAAFDGAGNLVTGGTNLYKLSPAGATIWTQPIAPIAIATGPSDTIYVHAGTSLVKLDAAGAQLWSASIPAGARGCPQGDFTQFMHCVAVAANGAVVVRGASQLAGWDADGNLLGTVAHADDGNFALAIDAAGIVNTLEAGPDFETRTLVRFALDGTPLEPVDFFCNQRRAMLFTVAGTVGCTSSGSSDVYGIGSVSVPDSDDVPTGMAGTGTGDRGWVFFLDDQALPLTGTYRMFRAGATSWETRGGAREVGFFDAIGTIPFDIAGSANGRLALVGRYDGFDPEPVRGWVKSFAP